MRLTAIKTQAAHLLRGACAEQRAQTYLIEQGLKPVERNFRCKHGELDLIMLDRQTLVIVEVRFRRNDRYGSAVESVTQSKQSRIIAATETYLAQRRHDGPLRFDVVALSGDGRFQWIQNAF